MGATDSRTIQTHLKAQRVERAYYLHGDDEHRKDGLLRTVIEAAVEPATRDFNLDVLRGSELDAERLDSLLQTPPLMASRRVVVVRDTGSLRKDVRATIERYLDAPSPDVVLVLVALAGTKEADFQNIASVACDPPRGEAFADWVKGEVQDVHGARISADAIQALQQALGSDTTRVASEIDKLVSYVQGRVIEVDAVRAVTGLREGRTLRDLLDAVASRNAPLALALIPDVLESPRNNAVTVIMALTVQTLALTWGHHARGRVDYFALLKSTGAFPMRSWGEAATCWSRNQKRWSERALRHAMRALRDADQAAKDTRVASDEQLLSSLVCAMCTETRRAAA